MSTTAGVFSETVLQNIRVRADEIMFDDRVKQQYIAHVGVMEAINKIQTARLGMFRQKDKDVTVEIEWMNTCGMEVEDNTACEVGGTKSSTNTEEHYLDIEQVVNFSANEYDFVTNDFDLEESIAKQKLTADKLLSEYFAQLMVARLNAYGGVNTLDTTSKGVVAGALTYIEPAYWTAELIAYLERVAVDNNFGDPFTISGANLFESYRIANFNAGNSDGKGKQQMFNAMNIDFDLKNIDQVNTPDLITYLVNRGAVAWASKSYYGSKIKEYTDSKRWSEPSRNIPGLEIEWHYKDECDEDSDLYIHHFKAKIKAGIFLNPTGCDENNTGVLRFICGTAGD